MINVLTMDEYDRMSVRVSPYCRNACLMEVKFYWDSTMTMDNGVLGKFRPSNSIYLPSWSKDIVLNDNTMIPTICHELTHYRQCKRWGYALWVMNNIPFLRLKLTEPEAMSEERRVRKELGLSDMDTDEYDKY